MPYPSDLIDEHWDLLEPVFNAPGKRGRRHADDLRSVVDAMLNIVQTGCQWRYLPESFGSWTRVWSPFRRWSRDGTWAVVWTVLHAVARRRDGRAEETPSMVVIDIHRARGIEWRVHVSRARWALRSHQGRQACRCRPRHQAFRWLPWLCPLPLLHIAFRRTIDA
jgi:transposase